MARVVPSGLRNGGPFGVHSSQQRAIEIASPVDLQRAQNADQYFTLCEPVVIVAC
ncbi:hypothetical protein AB0H83_46180 [Dactylosporangium sp. NPDC050688]|uniref:hypothetical protein n=1 Tax=Dactylosporangium sp. NPDC050688 TaxID=3157217 RepID=UPI0034070294